MELLDGKDLAKKNEEMQENCEKWQEADLAKMFFDLFNVVIHYQSQDIIHRDIKLDNIMFDKNNSVKLVDFGLALQTKGKIRELAGTGYYMGPGVINQKYGKECDLWSLGVTLYYLIEQKYPFTGKSVDEVFSKIKRA